MPSIVGVDFDNTVISYDDVMYKIALQEGFITAEVNKDKKIIRDKIRQLPEGEEKWRKIQAIVYGEAMGDAVLIDGVKQFFKACKVNNITAYIISHKGEFAAADERNINLRDSALHWMAQNKFFDEDGLGLSRDHVFFEPTRREKLGRIHQTGCACFIDDLEETFLEEDFPRHVDKILYDPHRQRHQLENVKIYSSWGEIREYFFN